jgi:hypothetical protein
LPYDGTWRLRLRRVQRILVTTLQDRLGQLNRLIEAIPVTVGSDARGFATRLRSRLNPRYLLHGDIRIAPDGTRRVYARALEPRQSFVDHFDWHTRDVTLQRTFWDFVYFKFSPDADVNDVEYPFEFASELIGLARALEGEVLLMSGYPDAAEDAFRAALQPVSNSNSHAIDEIRVGCQMLYGLKPATTRP